MLLDDPRYYLLGTLSVAAIGTYLLRDIIGKNEVGEDIGYLQATVLELINGMEQYPRKSASARAAKRTELTREFVGEVVKLGRPLPVSGEGTLDVTDAVFEVIDRNEKDGSGHWRRVNGVRRGCHILHALYELGEPGIAYAILIDHMYIQAANEHLSMHNHSHLKRLFRVPTTWPTQRMVEDYDKRGLPLAIERRIVRALNKDRGRIFDKVIYRPWPEGLNDDEQYGITHTGAGALLKQMRQYTR